jgi:hypothetical protein
MHMTIRELRMPLAALAAAVLACAPSASAQAAIDPAAPAPTTGACAMPAPSAAAKIVHLKSYETEALSSVSLGSQDAVTHAGRIWVEPGAEPLYVVVASNNAAIWQFVGAVDRIERAVVVSHHTGANSGYPDKPPLAGATGLPKAKLHFFPRLECANGLFRGPGSESVSDYLGRKADVTAEAYSVTSFDIPSGKIGTVEPVDRPLVISGFGDKLKIEDDIQAVIYDKFVPAKDDFSRFTPGGLVMIDASKVISNVPVAPYEVYPQHAGLIQLLESGAITQRDNGHYVVRKPTRFPAGLGVETFLIPKTVPAPEGDPGHACVILEDPTSTTRKFRPCMH